MNMFDLYRVILPVQDIEQAVAFYRHVFQVEGTRVSPGRHYFECGSTILACYDAIADNDTVGDGWNFHENQYLYFAVNNLAEAQSRVLAAGGELISEIESMPWGETLFYGTDGSGSRLCFVDDQTKFVG